MASTDAEPRPPPPLDAGDEPKPKRAKPQSDRVLLNPADCNLDFDVGEGGLEGRALHQNGFAYCWSGARATIGITRGKYCFGCKIMSEQEVVMEDTPPDQQHLCRVGISRGDDPVGNLGESSHSFGFGGTGKFSTSGKFQDYGVKFGVGDVIVCAVNLDDEPLATIGFSKNGQWLGNAWKFDAGPRGLGIVGSIPPNSASTSALFPHVLLKNVSVHMQFSTEDGLLPVDGYMPWNSAIEDGNAVVGPVFSKPKECEVLMMIGLPASGKTTWSEKWIKEHPEKRCILLGTNLALDQMKVPGLLRKQNYGERFDRLMDRATGIFNTLLSRASKTPHNYVIDQTNVYKSARKRKLKEFSDYRKVAVVVFPTPDELKNRAEKRFKEMGKDVPAEAVNAMLANFVLPTSKGMPRSDEFFDEVIFTELGRPDAQRYLEQMKRDLASAGKESSPYSRQSSLQPTRSPSLGYKKALSDSGDHFSPPADRNFGSPLANQARCSSGSYRTPDYSPGPYQFRAGDQRSSLSGDGYHSDYGRSTSNVRGDQGPFGIHTGTDRYHRTDPGMTTPLHQDSGYFPSDRYGSIAGTPSSSGGPSPYGGPRVSQANFLPRELSYEQSPIPRNYGSYGAPRADSYDDRPHVNPWHRPGNPPPGSWHR